MSKRTRPQWLSMCSAAAGFLLAASGGIGTARADVLPPLDQLGFQEEVSPAAPGSGVPVLFAVSSAAQGTLQSGGGGAYMVWVERQSGENVALRFSGWTGQRWDPASTIVSDAGLMADWANRPALTVLSEGTLICAWVSSGQGSGSDVMVSTSGDNGVTWAPPLRADKGGRKAWFPSLVHDTGEGFWVVWVDASGAREARSLAGKDGGRTPNAALKAAQWRNGAFVQSVVLDPNVYDCAPTDAARTLEGIVVAYRDRAARGAQDISLVRYERGIWGKPYLPHADGWVGNACPMSGPSLSSRESLLALAWLTESDGHPRVQLALSADSTLFSGSRVLQVDTGSPIGPPEVRLLPDESAIVAWIEKVGDKAEIRVRRTTLGGQSGPSLTIASVAPDPASMPRVAVRDLMVWLAWEDQSASPGRVRVGRLNLGAGTAASMTK